MSKLRKINLRGSLSNDRDLDTSSTHIVKITQQANNVVDGVIDRRTGFLQRMFPNEQTRAIVANELTLVKSEFEFRKRALEKVREMQIQSLSESLNQYLIREKADIRANTASFLMNKKLELQDEMDRLFDELMVKMEERLKRIEGVQNPTLQEIRIQKIEQDIENFTELQNHLVDCFQQIIFEGV